MEKKKILVIDDEPAIHKLLKVILEDEGFHIVGPEEQDTTPQSIIGGKPDLIILDIMMPEVNGFDVLKMLKEDADTSNIPVLILTVRNLKADIDKAMSLGANCYMTKPFEPVELIDNVKKLVSN
jgi:DNA-binding response OmpR family regulator